MSTVVTFDSRNLEQSVPGLIILSVKPRYPKRELTVDHIANTDESVNSASYYQDKKINIIAEIGRDNFAQLQDSLDTLYSILQGREKALIIPFGSSSRKWTATLANVSESDVKGGHATYDIEFECAKGLGVDTTSTAIFSEVLTGSSWTKNFTLGGTADWQQPVLTITYSALTGGTAKTVTIGNPATGQSLSITRTFAPADVLKIDSANKLVTVNNVEVASTGPIMEWAKGAGSMTYTDNFTTRTMATAAILTKRYI